jgi:hypothetical protein
MTYEIDMVTCYELTVMLRIGKNNHVSNIKVQCTPWKADGWSGLIEPDNSLPRSKEVAIRLFREPSEFSPNPHTRLL